MEEEPAVQPPSSVKFCCSGWLLLLILFFLYNGFNILLNVCFGIIDYCSVSILFMILFYVALPARTIIKNNLLLGCYIMHYWLRVACSVLGVFFGVKMWEHNYYFSMVDISLHKVPPRHSCIFMPLAQQRAIKLFYIKDIKSSCSQSKNEHAES